MEFLRNNATLALAILILSLLAVFYFRLNSTVLELAEVREQLTNLRAELNTLPAEIKQLRAGLAIPTSSETSTNSTATSGASEDKDQAVSPQTFLSVGGENDDPFFGPKDSPLLIMVFSDFQCKNCRRFLSSTFSALKADFAETKKAKLVFRDFPLKGNTEARTAAAFAHCAGEQAAYWTAFDLLLAKPDLVDSGKFDQLASELKNINVKNLNKCLFTKRYEKEMDLDTDDAIRLGAKGAPGTFVGRKLADGTFKGQLIRGAQPYGVIAEAVKKLL